MQDKTKAKTKLKQKLKLKLKLNQNKNQNCNFRKAIGKVTKQLEKFLKTQGSLSQLDGKTRIAINDDILKINDILKQELQQQIDNRKNFKA